MTKTDTNNTNIDEQIEQDDIQVELDDTKLKLEEAENRLKRALADYQNLEKRVSEGRSELMNWANTEFMGKVLPVLHHLETATQGASETDKASGWFKGVEMAVKEFVNVLKAEGLEEIDTVGDFDPAKHEAIDTKIGEDGKILSVVEKGFSLNGKVLKPAKVIVGRKN